MTSDQWPVRETSDTGHCPLSTDHLLVLNIGFTIGVDGPGQRMVVYLKGCNMSCPWCAAPESMNPRPEVLFYPLRLSNSSRADLACSRGAVTEGNRDLSMCSTCSLDCIASDNPAFELAGREMSVDEIVEQALRYRGFIAGGGVTIGGGEPTCQFDGLLELLTRLHEAGIHTAIETNGTSDRLPELFPLLDLVYIDLKHPDDAKCREITGQGNQTVLANIRARHEQGGQMVVRICLVPGYNSDDDTLQSYGSVLSSIGPLTVEILPFHRRGEAKWRALGLRMPGEDAREPTEEEVAHAGQILAGFGLSIV